MIADSTAAFIDAGFIAFLWAIALYLWWLNR